jgi:sugar lactone lactonase YvrE
MTAPKLTDRRSTLATLGATALLLAALASGCNRTDPSPEYRLDALTGPGSPFHGVHGMRFDDDGRLHATSVIGQSIFRVDTSSGAVERVVGPPEGMGDDLAFAADGTMYWTAIEDGIIYARAPNGAIRRVVENRKGVNAISFSPDRKRLFFTLVFYGDALYELDQAGAAPPRLIAENIGGLNAFQVGDDGMIYGPLMFTTRVVRIDPDTGSIATVSEEFESPGALKLDFNGSAYVLDGTRLKRLDLASGAITATAELPADADNLAIDAQGRVFVSMAAPNAILEVNVDSGTQRYVLAPSPLNSPTGLAIANDGGQETLYVGDLFGGVRRVDTATGAVQPTPPIELFQPAHVSITGDHLIAVSQVFGTVQRLDRRSLALLAAWEGFDKPGDAVEAANGDVFVADTGSGRVVRITGPEPGDREVVAAGLSAPTGLALTTDGQLFVTETGAGRVLLLTPGRDPGTVAEGLRQPEGIALASSGAALVVMEVGAKRLVRIALDSSEPTVLAEDLPVGLSNGPSLYRGIALGGSSVYFSSDIDNTIYALKPAAP